MSKTQATITYLADCRHFETLPSLVYLADWKSCLVQGHQLTELQWVRHYGGRPMADLPLAMERSFLETIFGRSKSAFAVLTEADIEVLEHVLTQTAEMSRWDLKRLVLSTHPCFGHEPSGKAFDLPSLALEYQAGPLRIMEAQKAAA